MRKITLLLIFVSTFFAGSAIAQNSNCGGNVPTFVANLTGSPDSLWKSPLAARVDYCCGNSGNDRCVQFMLTLDSMAQGIKFSVCEGAEPGGALFYRVNCGPEISITNELCLSTPGPHSITFCKPGNNANAYCIQSIPRPSAPNALTLNDGCTGSIGTSGFIESSITWSTIAPGAVGQYNSYLSCLAGCDTTTVRAQVGYPPFIDVQVCGVPLGGCSNLSVCKTTRINFNPTLFSNITPVNPTVCFGAAGTTITANGIGGTPPYKYQWNTGATTQSVFVTAGTYSVLISDQTDCPPTTASIVVTQFSNTITANAGSDQTVCKVSPATTLAGSVVAASGGIWSGGGGTFSPNNTTLNAVYTPSAAEVTAGSATLILTTTGNGTCPGDADTMVISIVNFQGTTAMTATNVTCNGGSDGTATATITGTATPYTYAWSNAGTTQTITGLLPGLYTVTVRDAIGCSKTDTISVTQPPPLTSATTQTNVKCFLGSDGSATVTGFGGNSGYTYVWSNSSGVTTNGATISGLRAGTYTVTITDSKGCTATNSVTITQPPIISSTISSKTNVSCFGGNDGAATVAPTGGTTPYTYIWSPYGGTGPNASGLDSGTYTITVTDINGCQALANTVIIQPASGVSVTTTQENVSCNGLSDGSATAIASGGTPAGGASPYTYSWSHGPTTATVTGLAAGTYIVTVMDSKLCPLPITVTITEPPVLSGTTSVVNTVCDLPTGQATIGVSGGTAPYTYLWSNTETTATIDSVMAGSYTVTVTDSNNCTITVAADIINNNPKVDAAITAFQNISCFGGSDGFATVTASGGTPNYTYVWSSGGGTGTTASGLPIGTYTVTVTDANTCSTTASVTLNQPTALTSSITESTNVSCNALSDGSATVTPVGGTIPYSYSWSPGGATDSTATGLAAATYTVTTTDDNGCTSISTVDITQPLLLTISATPSNVSCHGGNNGSATTVTAGGTPSYTYAWTPASSGNNNFATGLIAGNYTVTVTDANSCTAAASITITEPVILNASISQINVSCNGGNNGAAIVSASGGVTGYTYTWSNGGTDTTISNLVAGNYSVTVRDANNCTVVATTTITEPPLLTSTITGATNVSCFGGNDGTATVTASGGTTPFYTYLWSNNANGATASGLIVGNYTVTVRDAMGCTTTSSITLTQPAAALTTTIAGTNVSCTGGSDGTAIVTPAGGTPNYSFLWSTTNTTSSVSGLAAGSYSVTVTDSKGCQTVALITITEPTVLNVSIANSSPVKCFGGNDGMAAASVSGGTPGYTYSWNPAFAGTGSLASNLPAGTYTITVTDANSCTATSSVTITQPLAALTVPTSQVNNVCFGDEQGSATANPAGGTAPYAYVWSPGGATSQTINNLPAGTYTVNVTDTNGCTAAASVTITEGLRMNFSVSTVDATCGEPNGSTTISVTGGNSPYSIVWSNGDTGNTADSLASGAHTATVTDDSGCVQDTAALLNDIAGPSAVIFFVSNVTCFGGNNGAATVGQTGGVPPYTYSWNTNPVQTTAHATGLYAGVYIVTVTDSNGCQGLTVTNPEITQPLPFDFTRASENVKCNGGNDGSATVTVTGATPPYTYSWFPSGGTDSTATGLTAGTHTVTITDDNGCDTTATFVITEPPVLTTTISGTDVKCNSGNDGTASVVATGGTIPFYQYLWSQDGYTSPDVTGLSAGTYTVTVTDMNACTSVASIIIDEPTDAITSTTTQTDVSCFGGSDGSGTVIPSGGTGPYTYAWSPNTETNATANSLSANTYMITISDANLCQATAIITITEPPVLTATLLGVTNVKCFGNNTGSATVSASGGTAPYTYTWTSGGNAATETGLAEGNYTVTVEDAEGCTTTVDVTITEPQAALTVTATNTNVSCFGGSNATATATPAGGTSPYFYSWSPAGGTDSVATGLPEDTYTITVTDTNGCTASASLIITEPTLLTSSITSVTNVSCNGLQDGSATVAGNGGTPNYTYTWFPSGGINDTETGLGAGTYTAIVTDDNGCSTSVTATITQPTGMTASTTQTNVSCRGGNDGTATVIVGGGTAGYGYIWSSGDTDANANGLFAGTYTVTVTDANSCPLTRSVIITEPTTLTVSLAKTDVSCNGGNNGTVTSLVSGGTTGYTYSWSNGSNSPNLNTLIAGIYTVTVTDANNCTATTSITVTEPAILDATITGNDVSCFGGDDGSSTVTPSGGTPFYTYEWLPYGGTSPTASGLIAEDYTVLVTDINGCTTSATITISQPVAPLTTGVTSTDVSCFGGSNGTATAIPAGGTSPYSYLWTPGSATTITATNLIKGNYSVLVTDSNGCQVTGLVAVSEPSMLTLSATNIVNTFCQQVNGQITAAASGSVGGYSFAWSNGDTNITADSLAAGAYNVTVTDGNGCSAIASATITDTPGGTAAITSVKNVSCFGGKDGTATVTPSGGVPPYMYSWAPAGGTNATTVPVFADTFTVTVTDAKGCTATVSTIITEPTVVSASISGTSSANCKGDSNGSAFATASGGTPPYSYSWNTSPVQTNDTATGLAIGTYLATITDSLGCQDTVSAEITEPDLLLVAVGSFRNVTCKGKDDGTITAQGTGGIFPYTYSWSTSPTQTSQTSTGLSPGTYTITITDFNGCTATITQTITEPDEVVTLAAFHADTICEGVTATLSASATGGNGGYFFVWEPAPGFGNPVNVAPTVTTTYSVIAYDMLGCAGNTDTIRISVLSLKPDLLEVQGVTPICPGASSFIYATVAGTSTGVLTYSWSNGLAATSGVHEVTPTVPTTYFVTVTNECGVSVSDSIQIDFKPVPTIEIMADPKEGCEPLQTQFFDISNSTLDPVNSWFWEFGDGNTSTEQNPFHTYANDGNYNVSLTVTTAGGGCSASLKDSAYVVTVYPKPTAQFSVANNVVMLPLEPVITNNQSAGAISYNWNFGDGNTSTDVNPQHTYGDIGEYTITLISTSDKNCTDTFELVVTATSNLKFPTAFTPNPAGPNGGAYDMNSMDNDVFFPYTEGIEEFNLMIFNRWGELVFETKDVKIGWDGYYRGKLCQQDVYVWKVVAKFNDGRDFHQAGDVTLIR